MLWGSGPTNRLLVFRSAGKKKNRSSTPDHTPAIVDFLDQNYWCKPPGIRIYRNDGYYVLFLNFSLTGDRNKPASRTMIKGPRFKPRD